MQPLALLLLLLLPLFWPRSLLWGLLLLLLSRQGRRGTAFPTAGGTQCCLSWLHAPPLQRALLQNCQ